MVTPVFLLSGILQLVLQAIVLGNRENQVKEKSFLEKIEEVKQTKVLFHSESAQAKTATCTIPV